MNQQFAQLEKMKAGLKGSFRTKDLLLTKTETCLIRRLRQEDYPSEYLFNNKIESTKNIIEKKTIYLVIVFRNVCLAF